MPSLGSLISSGSSGEVVEGPVVEGSAVAEQGVEVEVVVVQASDQAEDLTPVQDQVRATTVTDTDSTTTTAMEAPTLSRLNQD